MKFIVVLATAILLTANEPKTPSCFILVPYILVYGEAAAIAWAKLHGYTDIQITAIKKRCGKFVR